MTPADPRVERLKTLHVDCIYAAMTLEREQGASAGFDETHPAWVAAIKADDAFFAALSEVLGDSQPVARLEHDTDEAGTLRVVYASPQRAEPASVQAPSRNAAERALAWETSPERVREVLRELVDGLERTNWSSWQTTAHFSTQLAAAQNLLAALAAHPSDQNHSG